MKRMKLLVLPALVTGLAACGSDGDNGGSNGNGGGTEPTVVTVQGRITSNTSWTANNTYLLRGAVFVDAGATLTIQAGTRVVGEKSSTGTLIVARGGRIQANGTSSAPIVMTSDQPVGRRARGDWGGLIINGNAPINVPGGQATGEGDTGAYGGSDPNDNSGALQYVRVEFAGIEFSPDNELNGIAFQGVGAGTTVDHVQVHFNKDDGLEFFGGTVSAKYIVTTAIGDDSFDWTEGWQGRGQFWVAQQKGDDADQGFESDSNAENNELLPRSSPVIYNATLIGAPGTQDGSESDIGMLLREGTAGQLYNFIVIGFKEEGVNIDGQSSIDQGLGDALFMRSAIIFNNVRGPFDADADRVARRWVDINLVDPQIADPYNVAAPNWQPNAAGPARNGAVPVVNPPSDGFFEPVTFIGAIGGTDWTRGWTTAAQN